VRDLFFQRIVWPTLVVMTSAITAEPSERSRPYPAAIHPERRQAAAPSNGSFVRVNPPSLLWPTVAGEGVRYAVRLSQDVGFPPERTIAADQLQWAMFNPHVKLAAGKWFWQYSAPRESGQQARWSEVYGFRVDDSARVFVAPPAGRMIAARLRDHPRILAATDELSQLRERLKTSVELPPIVAAAKECLGRELPDVSRALPTEKGDNAYQARIAIRTASTSCSAASGFFRIRGTTSPWAATISKTGTATLAATIRCSSTAEDSAAARPATDASPDSCTAARSVIA
jgi:hypothetical protein